MIRQKIYDYFALIQTELENQSDVQTINYLISELHKSIEFINKLEFKSGRMRGGEHNA